MPLTTLNSAEPQQATPHFDPRTDVSADARFLWKRIFIWFWAIPVIATLLGLLIINLK